MCVLGPCFMEFFLVSSLEEERAGCFTFFCCGCLCSTSLSHGANGLSAVCDCSMSFGMPSKLLKEADLSRYLQSCLCSMSLPHGTMG